MILTADDYGISRSVSEGIRELILTGKLTSVSCMVIGASAIDELIRLKGLKAEAGLHIVLSNDKPLSSASEIPSLVDSAGEFFSFSSLYFRCLFGLVRKEEIKIEIFKQLVAFKEAYGEFPRFLDGHQHVQQLPIIRKAMLEVYDELKLTSYIRVFRFPLRDFLSFKNIFSFHLVGFRSILENMAMSIQSQRLLKMLDQKKIPRNDFLLGHYPYSGKRQFKDVFEFYSRLDGQGKRLFICHPGRLDQELQERDPVAEARVDCLTYLLNRTS